MLSPVRSADMLAFRPPGATALYGARPTVTFVDVAALVDNG
jgi:hypothetical protein